jgi:hypothetical protein
LGKRLGEVLANFFHTFKLTLVYRNTEYWTISCLLMNRLVTQ